MNNSFVQFRQKNLAALKKQHPQLVGKKKRLTKKRPKRTTKKHAKRQNKKRPRNTNMRALIKRLQLERLK